MQVQGEQNLPRGKRSGVRIISPINKYGKPVLSLVVSAAVVGLHLT